MADEEEEPGPGTPGRARAANPRDAARTNPDGAAPAQVRPSAFSDVQVLPRSVVGDRRRIGELPPAQLLELRRSRAGATAPPARPTAPTPARPADSSTSGKGSGDDAGLSSPRPPALNRNAARPLHASARRMPDAELRTSGGEAVGSTTHPSEGRKDPLYQEGARIEGMDQPRRGAAARLPTAKTALSYCTSGLSNPALPRRVSPSWPRIHAGAGSMSREPSASRRRARQPARGGLGVRIRGTQRVRPLVAPFMRPCMCLPERDSYLGCSMKNTSRTVFCVKRKRTFLWGPKRPIPRVPRPRRPRALVGPGRRRRQPFTHFWISRKVGRGARIRTGDPLLPKQVRYQAALRPDLKGNRAILESWLDRVNAAGPRFSGFPSPRRSDGRPWRSTTLSDGRTARGAGRS